MALAKALLDLANTLQLGKSRAGKLIITGPLELSDFDKVVSEITAKEITKFITLMNIANTKKYLTRLENLAAFDKQSLKVQT